MAKIIDLHIHTSKSDGSFSPKEVIDMATKNNVSVLSFADHDTVSAYTPEIFDYAKNNNITLLPAVEISTNHKGVGIHVLGYNIDLNNQNLLNTLQKLRNSRIDYLFDVSKRLNELGFEIDTKSLSQLESVTKAHISSNIINNSKNTKLLFETFGHIPSKGEFIETIMNEGCPAYVKKHTITPLEASTLIKQAGGKSVLAHPVAYVHGDSLSESQIKELVDEMKPDGIESEYLYVDINNNLINDCKFWGDFATKNDLFATIGSDFHTHHEIKPEIGFLNYPFMINYNLNDQIIENLIKK